MPYHACISYVARAGAMSHIKEALEKGMSDVGASTCTAVVCILYNYEYVYTYVCTYICIYI